MRRKIISGIICILFVCGAALTGCQFVERDTKKDYRQIVTTIASFESGPSGGKASLVSAKDTPAADAFVSGERHIYKYELMNAINQQLSGRKPTESQLNAILQGLVDRELIAIEIERMIFSGELIWRDGTGDPVDFTDVNKVKKLRYDSIDQELKTIQRQILSDRDEPLTGFDGQDAEDPAPTFPVREPEVNDEILPEEEEWEPEFSRIPGSFGNAAKISLEAEALSRFADSLIRIVEDGYKDYDKAALEAAQKEFRAKIRAKQYRALYLSLFDSYPIEFLIGQSTTRQIQSELLQSYLTKEERIEVTDDEVEQKYKSALETQMLNFSNASAYSSAAGGTDLILYRPNADYFYVKHILVPFSDDQRAKLDGFKARPNTTHKQITEFRERLVNEIVAYPHPDGFEDYSSPTTAQAIFNEVRAAVSKASSVVKEAERRFDDFIYLYNTDPGAFQYTSGYSVKKVLEPYESPTYMKEFEDGARDLWENYKPGQVLDYYVVTDYGVHIMYYASDTEKGSIKRIGDYETPAGYKTVFEIYEKELRAAKEGAAYSKWYQATLADYTQNDEYVKKFENRYKDIYE